MSCVARLLRKWIGRDDICIYVRTKRAARKSLRSKEGWGINRTERRAKALCNQTRVAERCGGNYCSTSRIQVKKKKEVPLES